MNRRADLTLADYAGIAFCIFMLAVVFPAACTKEAEFQRLSGAMAPFER